MMVASILSLCALFCAASATTLAPFNGSALNGTYLILSGLATAANSTPFMDSILNGTYLIFSAPATAANSTSAPTTDLTTATATTSTLPPSDSQTTTLAYLAPVLAATTSAPGVVTVTVTPTGYRPDTLHAIELQQQLREAHKNMSTLRIPTRPFHTKARKATWLACIGVHFDMDSYCSAMFMEDSRCADMITWRPWILSDVVLVAYKRAILHYVNDQGVPYDTVMQPWYSGGKIVGSGPGQGMQTVIDEAIALLNLAMTDSPRGGQKAKYKWLHEHDVLRGDTAYCAAMFFEDQLCDYILKPLTEGLSYDKTEGLWR